MSGGKGGSTTQSVQIPSWMQNAAKRNLARAEQASQLGYMPYYGPDVAAPSPMLQSAWQGVSDQAAAFGMGPSDRDVMAGMPTAKTYEGGVTGYSSGDLYDQALAEFRTRRPGQAASYDLMFVDPQTGLMFSPDQSQTTSTAGMGQSSSTQSGVGDGEGFQPDIKVDPYAQYMAAQNLRRDIAELNPLARAFIPGLGALDWGAKNLVADPYEMKTGLTFTPYPEGQANDRGDAGYVTGTYGDGDGSVSISYGTANEDGTNPTSTISGGSGRTDKGFGW